MPCYAVFRKKAGTASHHTQHWGVDGWEPYVDGPMFLIPNAVAFLDSFAPMKDGKRTRDGWQYWFIDVDEPLSPAPSHPC